MNYMLLDQVAMFSKENLIFMECYLLNNDIIEITAPDPIIMQPAEREDFTSQ